MAGTWPPRGGSLWAMWGKAWSLQTPETLGGAGLGAAVGWGRGKMGWFGAFSDLAHATPSARRCNGCRVEAGCCSHRSDGSHPPAPHGLPGNLQLWRSSISARWFERRPSCRPWTANRAACVWPRTWAAASPQPAGNGFVWLQRSPERARWSGRTKTRLCSLHPPGPKPGPGKRNPAMGDGDCGWPTWS